MAEKTDVQTFRASFAPRTLSAHCGQGKDLQMKTNIAILFLVTSVISLMVPIFAGFFAVKDEVNLPSVSVFLLTFVYVTGMYAVAGGFESSQRPLPKWRFTLFVFLGGLGLSIILGLFWFGIRILLGKVFRVQELENFRLLNSGR
jgi:hypothetical protein